MSRLIRWALAPLAALFCAFAAPALAATADCTDASAYTHNTTGTTQNGVLEALCDHVHNSGAALGADGDTSPPAGVLQFGWWDGSNFHAVGSGNALPIQCLTGCSGGGSSTGNVYWNPHAMTDGATGQVWQFGKYGAWVQLVDADGNPYRQSDATHVTTDSGSVVQNTMGTTGGCTPYHLPGGTAASTNSTSLVSGAHTLCKIVPINTTGTIYFLKVYDSSSAPTCSSATNLKHVYPIPANTSGAGFWGLEGPVGEAYANGIAYCVTASGGDTANDNAATGVYIEASYK